MKYKEYEVAFSPARLNIICVIAGFNAAELTPKYPDFISERVYALHAAARWWYEYREDILTLK